MTSESRFQIGKNSITQGFIETLNLSFKTHDQIRISLLKSSERDRIKIIAMADEIVQKVNYHCNYRIIGFTIILRKRSSKLKKIIH